MRAHANFYRLTREWLDRSVTCYIRNLDNSRRGPYTGTVKGLSTNQAAIEDEGGSVYDATGLLVEIPELGRHEVYGEWYVLFTDAALV